MVVLTALGLVTMTCSMPVKDDVLSATVKDLHERIPALMEVADVHGFTIAVAEHGELVWSAAHGMASAELALEAAPETIFEAASLGKVVLALITLRMADEGLIDLDETIAENFEYALLDHDERYTQLTPRLILQHASGLPNWGGWALDVERDPVQFVGNPGEVFGYSGEAYVALQRFVGGLQTATGND